MENDKSCDVLDGMVTKITRLEVNKISDPKIEDVAAIFMDNCDKQGGLIIKTATTSTEIEVPRRHYFHPDVKKARDKPPPPVKPTMSLGKYTTLESRYAKLDAYKEKIMRQNEIVQIENKRLRGDLDRLQNVELDLEGEREKKQWYKDALHLERQAAMHQREEIQNLRKKLEEAEKINSENLRAKLLLLPTNTKASFISDSQSFEAFQTNILYIPSLVPPVSDAVYQIRASCSRQTNPLLGWPIIEGDFSSFAATCRTLENFNESSKSSACECVRLAGFYASYLRLWFKRPLGKKNRPKLQLDWFNPNFHVPKGQDFCCT
ncbi:hypothetical protein O6H91_16G065100 [Diphasiastrum complanatum]|uniref:Uncharacterized protein n=1 Tax=Diphasiastrum complanatum TaxID=34168 RepID=A0ACC2BD16_DIPCM|nr:hypothetical protein O6H91_16G065100 [Diphasiastrum complanatum]